MNSPAKQVNKVAIDRKVGATYIDSDPLMLHPDRGGLTDNEYETIIADKNHTISQLNNQVLQLGEHITVLDGQIIALGLAKTAVEDELHALKFLTSITDEGANVYVYTTETTEFAPVPLSYGDVVDIVLDVAEGYHVVNFIVNGEFLNTDLRKHTLTVKQNLLIAVSAVPDEPEA